MCTGLEHLGEGHEQRELVDGFIEVTVGGEPIEVGKPIVLLVDTTYNVTITKLEDFKGIMTRISGGDANADTSAAFILPQGGEQLLKQNTQFCDPVVR